MLNALSDYINPRSVTFWSAILLIIKAVAHSFGVDVPVLASIPDDALLGAAAVGLRRAIGANGNAGSSPVQPAQK